jgi:IclR family transcriptional regulator, KDG regulon repressor
MLNSPKLDGSPRPDGVAAVMKFFVVLEALAEEKSMSLGDLAQRTMTSKSTAYRFLQTMLELGYVQQEGDTEKYGLTLKLYGLGAKVLNRQLDLVRVADKAMSKLSQRTREAVNLGVLDEQELCVVYVHKYDSLYNLCMQSPIGKRNPLHCTSLGKALLAWRDDDDIARILGAIAFPRRGPNTITDPAVLFDELKQIRRQGFAEEIEEIEAGVRCMAVPVFDRIGRTAAAISISFPVFRFDEARKADHISLLQQAARSVSEGLGYIEPPRDPPFAVGESLAQAARM